MERTCRICGATLTEGVAYCTNCGASNGGGQMIPETQINLKIWVKVRENWRDSETQIRNFGYDRREIQ